MHCLSAKVSRYLPHSITIPSHAQDLEHRHGTCAAGLPGICDVNLVSDTMGDGISSSAWSRGTSKPEKPTQGAPARAGCPTPAAKSAPSGAHSAQITQVCEWRTRPIAWPSRRRNRFLNSGLRFLTLDTRPPRARTLPKPQINFHSRLERRFQNSNTSPLRPETQCFQLF